MKRKILLDTNFLLIPYQFKVDIFTQIDKISIFKYKIFILDKTLQELNKIVEEQKGKNKDAARIALKLISIKDIEVIKTESNKNTDDTIYGIALKDDFIVATQDKDLKRKLVNQGCKVIILKQKKILAIINDKGFV